MGWTFAEYKKTPASVIEEVWMFMNTEAKAMNDELGKK